MIHGQTAQILTLDIVAKPRRRAPGFTLIEILVVVLVTAILAGMTSLTLVAPAQAATLDDVVRKIAFLDATARHTARRSGHTQRIAFDLEEGVITSQDIENNGVESDLEVSNSNWTQKIHLPRGFRIGHVWLVDQESEGSSTNSVSDKNPIDPDGLGQATGQITIDCSADGYTPSYGLSIIGPQSERRWLMLAGLSGQPLIAHTDQYIRSLLELHLGSPDSDAATQPGQEHP